MPGPIKPDKLPLHLLLKKTRKTVRINPIVLKQKLNNARFCNAEVPTYTSIKPIINIVLLVTKSTKKIDHYSFQLMCKALAEDPYIRFDSDGPAHMNRLKGKPIQSVTTPHFNGYDVQGFPFAYKTKHMNNAAKEAALKNDINLGARCFCEEANVRLNKNGFPAVEHHIKKFEFQEVYDDPNQSVNFKV